jgi:hypothetical protein
MITRVSLDMCVLLRIALIAWPLNRSGCQRDGMAEATSGQVSELRGKLIPARPAAPTPLLIRGLGVLLLALSLLSVMPCGEYRVGAVFSNYVATAALCERLTSSVTAEGSGDARDDCGCEDPSGGYQRVGEPLGGPG